MASALRVAAQALEGSRQGSRAVLLVTDAEAGDLEGLPGEALRARLAALAEARLPVFVWAMSDPRGLHRGSSEPQRRPDHEAWAQAVRPTGGSLVPVQTGDADLDALVGTHLVRLLRTPVDSTPVRAWHEAYRAPLALGLLLWMLAAWPSRLHRRTRAHRAGTKRPVDTVVGGMASMLVIASVLLTWPGSGDARPAGSGVSGGRQAQALERQAWQAWQSGRWSQAELLYARIGTDKALLAASAAAIRAGDGPAAQRWAGRALWLTDDPARRLDALHNLGHAHALQSRWDVAAETWAAVLQARPGDARAAANLAVAQAELARRSRRPGGASDLRGRRGLTLEGLASTEGGEGREPPALADPQDRRGAGGAVEDARLDARTPAAGPASAGPEGHHLVSGLAKMPRLVDARQALVRGLVRQDRDSHAGQGLSPW